MKQKRQAPYSYGIPQEYSHLHLPPKDFFSEIEVQDFPIRGKAVYLRVKYRHWEDPETGQTYGRDWNLVTSGKNNPKTRKPLHLPIQGLLSKNGDYLLSHCYAVPSA